jgi:hypothetical protein
MAAVGGWFFIAAQAARTFRLGAQLHAVFCRSPKCSARLFAAVRSLLRGGLLFVPHNLAQ